MSIRIVAIEDDAQYRSSLELLFRQSSDFELVETFGSPAAALARLTGSTGNGVGWQMVLMDIELPGMDGVRCTRLIKERLPDVTVVALTVFEDRATILEAICAGADGYLLKRTSGPQLLEQLGAIADGGSPLSAGVARTVVDVVRRFRLANVRNGDAAGIELTEREQEVLRCLVEGMSYKRVARQLDISIDTVRSHIRSVYRKLQVHTVAEAVNRALRQGLV